jgi:hypothetical protein
VSFASLQPKFAARGIATFPVGIDGDRKKPLIKGYGRIGLRGSTELAAKFRDATMFGYMAGPNSGLATFDWDSTDERGFADALDYFGDSPFKVRTPSKKFHSLYRYNGEGRKVRQLGDLPADILGGGVIVAPGSVIPGVGEYEIIEGHLDDIPQYLPVLRNLPPYIYKEQQLQIILPDSPASDIELPIIVPDGVRNTSLWRFCMSMAARTRHLSDEDALNELMRGAMEFNQRCVPPKEEREVMEAVASAWDYEQRGENWFGRHGVYADTSVVNRFATTNQDAGFLWWYLKANNHPLKIFWCANGLAETLGWSLRRLQAARNHLIQNGDIIQISKGVQGRNPALYVWPMRGRYRGGEQ